MTFDWSEYLVLAQELAGQGGFPVSAEARLRAAISRAYYAAFHKALDYLRDREGWKPSYTGRDHTRLAQEFQSRSNAIRQQIGVHLDRLKVDREKADYDNMVAGIEQIAEGSLLLAERVLSGLSQL